VLADRRDGRWFLVVAAMMLAGTPACLLLSLGAPWALFPAVVLAYGLGWAWAGLLTHAVTLMHPEHPGRATGITQSGVAVGGALGPLGFGRLSDAASLGTAWSVTAAASLLAAAVVVTARRAAAAPPASAEPGAAARRVGAGGLGAAAARPPDPPGPRDPAPRRRCRARHHAGMTLADPAAPTARELAADVRAGRTDPVELVERALARLAEVDDDVRAFVHVDAGGAREQARARASQGREGGPLHGVPVAVKDLYDVAGHVTTAGSRVPLGPVARQDATAVRRLREAGAVVLGRTRTHEFAWGLTTWHPELGGRAQPARPRPGVRRQQRRVGGGGRDRGWWRSRSAPTPAARSACPPRGAGWWGTSRRTAACRWTGVVPLAPSLDVAGAITRDAADARLALEVLTGRRLPAPQDTGGLRVGSSTTRWRRPPPPLAGRPRGRPAARRGARAAVRRGHGR
jgi:hypothetical protein